MLLPVAALAGNLLLAGVQTAVLALVRCFAGGAALASLAAEVFPKSFKEDSFTTRIAAATGLILAPSTTRAQTPGLQITVLKAYPRRRDA